MAIAINAESPMRYEGWTSTPCLVGATETRRIHTGPRCAGGVLQPVPEFLRLLNVRIDDQRLTKLWAQAAQKPAVSTLDKAATLNALEQLKALPSNWSGYDASPIDPDAIRAAQEFILALPGDLAPTPQVVPMTRGRLQFEWHRGNRSLELEFESPDTIHYLQWDSDLGVEEEAVIPANELDTVHGLLRWFSKGPRDV